MITRRVALLLVAVMVGVAGCAGSDVGPSNRSDANATTTVATATSTTTPSGTATTTASPNVTLPPGVNRSGVEAPSALVAAHRSALNDTGFSFRFRANVSVGPASQWTVQRGTVERGLSPLAIHSTSVRHLSGDATTFTTDIWANRSTAVVRYRRANRTQLGVYDRDSGNFGVPDETWAHLPRADLGSQVTQSWLLELALTAGEFDLVGIQRLNDRRVAVLRADEAVAAANFTDFDATVVVDRTGRVRSLELTAAYEGDNGTRIHYEFELTEVGSVGVERPRWVGAAIPPSEPNATVEDGTTATSGNRTTANETGTTRNATTTSD